MSAWHARTAGELDAINGVVHDAWFDFDDVEHDRDARTLTIPFAQDWFQVSDDAQDGPSPELVAVTWRYRDVRVPYPRGVLRIGNVRGVEQDGAIGDAGMLFRLEHDARAGRITVHGASGALVAEVDELDLACEVDPKVIALVVQRRYSRLFGTSSEKPLWDSAPRS